jgi:hypothetical protein
MPNSLSDLLVTIGRELCRARRHDGIRWRDVLFLVPEMVCQRIGPSRVARKQISKAGLGDWQTY